MPLVMQYVIVLRLLVTEILYYFTYFSCLSKNPIKPQNAIKPTGLGFFKKKTRVFFEPWHLLKQDCLQGAPVKTIS